MQFFDGKKEAKLLDEVITSHIAQNKPKKRLLIAQIGENKESESYVNLKVNLCHRLGINVQVEKYSDKLSNQELLKYIKDAFEDENVKGGLIQLPFPRKSLEKTIHLIPLDKDIDVLKGNIITHNVIKKIKFTPPIVRAVEHFIKKQKFDLFGRDVSILGGGRLVGRTLAYHFRQEGANVTVYDSEEMIEKNFKDREGISFNGYFKDEEILKSDLVVFGLGEPNKLKGEHLSERSHAIDFGSSIVDGKTVGDLDLDSDLDHLGVVSPSPGGMGPLVTRYLLMNFLGI